MTALNESDIWTYFSRNSLSSFLSACNLWQSFAFKSVVWILFLAPDVLLDWLDSLYLFWVVLSSVRYSQYHSLRSCWRQITVSIIRTGSLQVVGFLHWFSFTFIYRSIPHSYFGSNFWTVVWTFMALDPRCYVVTWPARLSISTSVCSPRHAASALVTFLIATAPLFILLGNSKCEYHSLLPDSFSDFTLQYRHLNCLIKCYNVIKY